MCLKELLRNAFPHNDLQVVEDDVDVVDVIEEPIEETFEENSEESFKKPQENIE